ncbi:MAG: hypothetical protein GY847_14835 [Proteobacteria bacterium]|nr:hypothetical protein [Pseudomonadota bacterium]
MSHILLVPTVTCLVLSLQSMSARADDPNDIVIFANKSVAVNTITIEKARLLFLKIRKSWKKGGKAIAIHASVGEESRNFFVNAVLNRTISEDQSYWQKQKVMTGETPPPEFKNTLKAVFSIRNSISYCLRKDYLEGVVKILLVIPAAPGG